MWGYTEEDEKLAWWECVILILALPFIVVGAVLLEVATAVFHAAEWALHKRRAIQTAIVALCLSLALIWAVSTNAGM